MSITFDKTYYFKAIIEDDFMNEETIFDFAKKNLQFHYGQVNLQKYKEKYSSEGWLRRKIIALPAAIWSGVIKTICHLAAGILVGMIKAPSDGGKYLKVCSFYVARDVQEFYGWIATLFNDEYGQYHIHESGFHKSCYELTDTNPKTPITYRSGFVTFNERPSFGFKPKSPHLEQAEDYFKKADFKKALDAIKSISIFDETEEKEAFIAKIATSYFDQGKLDQALETINLISVFGNINTKEALIAKIATSYFDQGRLDKALKTIKLITFLGDTKTKDAFIERIARTYFDQGKLDHALKAINSISAFGDIKTKVALIAKIATSYLNSSDKSNAIKLFIIILENLLNKLAQNRDAQIYLDIMQKNYNGYCTFFAQLAEACYTKITNPTGVDAQSVLRILIQEAKAPATLAAFLQLRPQASKSASWSNSRPNPSQNSSKSPSSPPPANLHDAYYTVLGLQSTASKEEVKTTYRRLSKSYHPDKINKAPNETQEELQKRKQESEEKFRILTDAYNKLLKIIP